MKIFIALILCLSMYNFNILYAQKQTITGKVILAHKNTPVSSIKVSLENINISTITDENGNFNIEVPITLTNIKFANFEDRNIEEVKQISSNSYIIYVGDNINDLFNLSLEDLINTQVRTVTLKDQKITNVPGIVSIITQEDLKALGIRTIREALTLIPGFAPMQNDDEQILSVRGIFATTNQKILVMRDGHSLNEGNLDIPQTEYSLSIENIKKIEIIRGPGASIYGNSALAAVVNIITTENEGIMLKAGIGNFGQLDLDGNIGYKTKDDGYFLAFGRYSNTDGEPFNVLVEKTKSQKFSGKYKTYSYPNNYDIGFKFKNGLYTTSFSTRRHEYDCYWTSQGIYTNIDSLLIKPRLTTQTNHFDLLLTPAIDKQTGLFLQNYVDFCTLNDYRQTGPIDSLKPKGDNSIFEWNVVKLGINYYLNYDFSENSSFLFGFSLEKRQYYDSYSIVNNTDQKSLLYSNKPFMPEGKEVRGAVFLQLQHNLYNWLKTDIGARYDMAENFNSSFNPRLALIFNPLTNFTLKAIYTKAFQAPGYSYRSSNVPYAGSISKLEPEILTTYQFALRYDFRKSSFVEISTYYNQLRNLITRYSGKYYENYGKVADYGLEIESRINYRSISIFGNYSLLLPDTSYMDSKFIASNIKDNSFKNIPKHTVNLGIISHIHQNFDISLYGQYSSSFYSINNDKISSKFIINSTITSKNLYYNIDYSLSIYNLLNTEWMLGDPSVQALRQPGRWFMFRIIYNI